MRAAWHERQGPAREVLVVSEMDDPRPSHGEVRIRIAASGVNPGDVKKHNDAFGYGMSYPRVIPHSDGAGTIESSATASRRSGSGAASGASARRAIGRSAPWRSCASSRARGAVGSLAVKFAERAGARVATEDTQADHIVDVALAANIARNAEFLAQGGSIAAYATDDPHPSIPFWPLLFQNARIFLLGSDDFPLEAKLAATRSRTRP